MSSVSILMCSYNGDKLLSQTVNAISKIKTQHLDYVEFVFIDNHSKNDLQKLVRRIWEETDTTIRLKTAREIKRGKTAAFLTGFSLCEGEYIVVCDDDNELFDNYLEEGVSYFQNRPEVGVLGACGLPKSEIDIPDWFSTYLNDFACGPQANQTGDVYPGRNVVYGAGLWFRSAALKVALNLGFQFMFDYVKDNPTLKNRSNGGEDGELCWAIKYQGYEIHYLETLKFNHLIDKEKFTPAYLKLITSRKTNCTLLSQVYRRAYNMEEAKVQHYWKKELFFLFLHYIKNFKFNLTYLKVETSRNISNLNFLLSYRSKYDAIFNHLLSYKQHFK